MNFYSIDVVSLDDAFLSLTIDVSRASVRVSVTFRTVSNDRPIVLQSLGNVTLTSPEPVKRPVKFKI